MRKLLLLLFLTLVTPVLADVSTSYADPTFNLDSSISLVVNPGDIATGQFSITSTSDRPSEIVLTASPGVDISEVEFTLNPGEQKDLTYNIPEINRINTFLITASDGNMIQSVPGIVELEDVGIVFDSLVRVNASSKSISAGETVLTSIEIFSLESIGTQELILKYALYNQNNEEINSGTETVFSSERKSIQREIIAPSYLTDGNYVLAVILQHGSRFSTSTDTFTIRNGEISRPFAFDSRFFIVLLGIALVIVILLLKTHRHLEKVEEAHDEHARELRKHKHHMSNRRALNKYRRSLQEKINVLDEALSRGIISRLSHKKAYEHLKKRINDVQNKLKK